MARSVFNYSGAAQTFVVPAGVTSILCELWGAWTSADGTAYGSNVSWGGYVEGLLAVTPGQVLNIYVGGEGSPPQPFERDAGWNGGGVGGGFSGSDGVNGGGGGGATDIRVGGNTLANRVAVAGGAGGWSGEGYVPYGIGGYGGSTGGAGGNPFNGTAPTGATVGGTGGAAGSGGLHTVAPTAGSSGQGGAGATASVSGVVTSSGGGGGGGGYFGGGGGDGYYSDVVAGQGGAGGCNYVGGLTSTYNGDGYALASVPPAGWDINSGGGFVALTYNLPPNAPTVNQPVSGTYIADDLANIFAWTFSDPDAGDTQSAADLRWRVGAGAWTTVSNISTTATQSHSFASGYWTAEAGSSVEFQIRTYDSSGVVGPWSSSAFFTPVATPTAPAITSPADGATMGQTTESVTWTFASQRAYQVQRIADNAGSPDPGTVYSDTGQVANGATHTLALNFSVNNRYEHIRVRAQNATSSLWSDWTDVRVHVAYEAPAVPTLTVTAIPGSAAVELTITNPAPTGDEPDVATQAIFGVLPDGTVIPIAAGMSGHSPDPVTYWRPIAGMQFFAVATSIIGTLSQSDTSDPLVLKLQGVWLLDPDDNDPGGNLIHLIYNDTGAVEAFAVEAVTTHVAGRARPIVDFGDAEDQSLSVNVTMVDGDQTANGVAHPAALRALIRSRKIVLYRDPKGRRLWGVVNSNPITDAYGRTVTQIALTVTDYTELPMQF
jgi:hypothetical protein